MGLLSAWRVSGRNRARAYMQRGVRYDGPSVPNDAAHDEPLQAVQVRAIMNSVGRLIQEQTGPLWDVLRKAEQQHSLDLKAIHETLARPANTGGVNAVRNLALQLAIGAVGQRTGNPMEVIDTAQRFYAFLQGDA